MTISFDDSFDPPAPVAKVVIRDRKTGERSLEISMLLDTGSDVSLLPNNSIRSMGLRFSSNKRLDLVGFDGSPQSFETVEAQIVFADKRFTGIFCGIDDDLGILGRDILNQMTITLDGPRLEWIVNHREDNDMSS